MATVTRYEVLKKGEADQHLTHGTAKASWPAQVQLAQTTERLSRLPQVK